MSEFATPPDGPSAGTLLRSAREAAGLHLESLAIALKVPPRKLEALEQDRYDLLPDLTFARALASSVCRVLKIDPQPVLERLPQSVRPRLAQVSDGINTPFREPGAGSRAAWLDQLTRPVALTVVALLLAAVVIIFLPTVTQDASPEAPLAQAPTSLSTTVGSEAAQALPAAMPPAPAASVVTTAPAPVAIASSPAVPPTSTSTLVASAVPAARASAPARPASAATPDVRVPAPALAVPAATAPAVVASAAAGGAAPASSGEVVTFRARGASWIQVSDASGKAVLRRLLQPGETASASGALPLSVTVGSATGTEVQVRGKPFNLEPVSRDNVARFEVK